MKAWSKVACDNSLGKRSNGIIKWPRQRSKGTLVRWPFMITDMLRASGLDKSIMAWWCIKLSNPRRAGKVPSFPSGSSIMAVSK